jgi:serine phosphatase RsbU (regulator of sigma subunit)
MPAGGRTDRQCVLAPDATLLLYTDGLIERRGEDMDVAIGHAAALLVASPVGLPLSDLLSQLIGEVAGPAYDDAVLLAVRIPPA